MTATAGGSEIQLLLHRGALPALRLEHGITRRVLLALPPSAATWRPAAGARTALELAGHIVEVELRYLTGAVHGAFPLVEPSVDPSVEAMEQRYARRFDEVVTMLKHAADGDLVRVLDYKGLISMPALGFVQLAINHTIHHRGQLSVYLRMMGVAVPSIYG